MTDEEKTEENTEGENSSKDSKKAIPTRGSKSKKGKKSSKKEAKKEKADSEENVRTSETKRPGDTRYVCVHCGHGFWTDEDPTRCPSCMRKGGLEAVDEKTEGRPAWVLPVAALALIGAIGGGYMYWSSQTPDVVEGEVPEAPLSLSELRGHLRAQHADGPQSEFFEVKEHIRELAEHAEGSTPLAKAESLVAYIRDRAEAGAFGRWSLARPRETPPHDSDWAAEQLLAEDDRDLYPLEVAGAVVSALRSQDVPAMVAEIWAFPGDRQPPDPSGKLGYFGVALTVEGTTHVLDPYAGHARAPDGDSYRVLNDVQVIAAFLGTKALQTLVHEGDSVAAMRDIRTALTIDERSPYLRSTQAAVLIVNGGTEQGMEELRAAAQLRGDGPRRNNLAGVYMALGNVEQASREVAAAIEQFPDYAAARATLAALHLEGGELELGHRELVAAERIDRENEMLPMLFAQYHLRLGEVDQALQRARQAIRQQPNQWQAHLSAARIFRAAGAYDEMRAGARRAVELIAPDKREMLRAEIHTMLGPTALEDVDEDPVGSDEEDYEDEEDWESEGGPGDLRLDSDLLGESGGGGPSLLGEELGGGGGLQLGGGGGLGGGGLGGGGGLQLGGGGGGGGLRLNLGE